MNENFHFPGDFHFSSKFQEMEMEFQEKSRRWPPWRKCFRKTVVTESSFIFITTYIFLCNEPATLLASFFPLGGRCRKNSPWAAHTVQRCDEAIDVVVPLKPLMYPLKPLSCSVLRIVFLLFFSVSINCHYYYFIRLCDR